jgi:RNA polymerase sigma-70 factor (ECF subfamily)
MLPTVALLPNTSVRLNIQSPLEDAYHSRHSALARFLAARLGNQHDAQDVLQELYLHISTAEPSSEIRDPVAYVFRTAANLARDYIRTRRRAASREFSWAALQYSIEDSQALDDSPSAERAYEGKQRFAAVQRVLNELSPQCRRIFILHKLEGLSHQQIAERANISRSTVEKHMNPALKHLIRRLGRD